MLDIGIISWFSTSLPMERRLSLIKQAGFASTSLWLGREEEEVRAGNEESLPYLVLDSGLILNDVHMPYENCNRLWSVSGAEVEDFISEARRYIRFCRNHAIPILVMHVSQGDDPPQMTESGFKAIETIAKSAEDSYVTIALENTRRPDYLEAVLESVTSAAIRLCYDSSHDFMRGKTKGELVEKWGHLMVTTHMSDSFQEDTDDHLVPGNGSIDWRALAEKFKAKRYRGTLMLEAAVPDNEAALISCREWLVGFRNTVTGIGEPTV